jgi:hypothetical protein
VQLTWTGAYRGGRLLVDLDLAEVWDRLEADVDRPYWQGGPVFRSKPFRGTVDRGFFYFHHQASLFGGRRNAVPTLTGRFHRADGGTLIEFGVEQPLAQFIVMPLFLLGPVGLGVVVFVALLNGGSFVLEALAAGALCAAVPFLFFLGFFSLVIFKGRWEARQLVRALWRMFADVAIEQALPGPHHRGEDRSSPP